MKILIISGFLGAGKTTFIKELIHKTDIHPVIMENEYGDNNIDSKDLQQENSQGESLQILEFMEGCVCCTMKDSFVNSVLSVYASLSPEYLVIEPTGVGKLGSILDNLKPILHGDISLLKPVTVLSPSNFEDNMRQWPELYKNQIEAAQIIAFSKCEHESLGVIKAVSDKIHAINPNAELLPGHYKNVDADWWKELMEAGASETKSNTVDTKNPSSSFSQVTFDGVGFHSPTELVMLLEDCLHGEFGNIARAKGTLWAGGELIRFDLADRMYEVGASPVEDCQCVFIGENLDKNRLKKRLAFSEKSHRDRVRLRKTV
ncbi:hypothetical protein D6856_07570 [Butyrivibrio sp. XB500-5]|uniref:CobW family GTP-binding protein n=1 Tax=Butyrivibrio sp. XB500-5 TaxID=2364880 RepID=UPI000EA9C757|nr:GTP-binding protein [Butyrivibrio sp. XB500-5]RKM60899.1 hypothetical protein D6856_07570 [Butyrivibrio sp. XB500-5]